jgi:tetratricopeptide (TPR) repeat protein
VKQALILLLILAINGLPAAAKADDEFATYLHELGLMHLYIAELRNQCLEGPDLAACRAYNIYLGEQGKHHRAIAFIDSVNVSAKRLETAGRLLKAEALFNGLRYSDAYDLLDSLIAVMPPKVIMLEAVLLRAKAAYRLGRVDEALQNLRALEAYLKPSDHPEFALWLARCEEEVGDLGKARDLYELAWKQVLPDAALGLMRVTLKQGDEKGFFEVDKQVTRQGVMLPPQGVCELAQVVGDLLPRVWHALMVHALADTNLTAATCPGAVNALVKMAEAYEPVRPYCDRLMAGKLAPDMEEKLEYACAFSSGYPETLFAVLRKLKVPDLRLRGTILYLNEPMTIPAVAMPVELVTDMVPLVADLAPNDLFEFCGLLAGRGHGELVLQYLDDLRRDLDYDFDHDAILVLAGMYHQAGASETAIEMYGKLAHSKNPSLVSLRAERELLGHSQPVRSPEEMAGDLERVAAEGVSDLELGDLFAERFGDYERAVRYYKRALTSGDDEIDFDRLRLKLAETLAQAWLKAGRGAKAKQRSDEGRIEALDIVISLAESDTVSAQELVSGLKLASDFLKLDHDIVREGISEISLRDDLAAGDLYEMAKVLYYLHLRGDKEAHQECVTLVDRLTNDFPVAEEAGHAVLLDAALRFDRGDYVGALERYKLCLERWSDASLESICNEGIGSCYLYSGGLTRAITHLKQAGESPLVCYGVAGCYRALGEPDSARVYYSKCLEVGCRDTEVFEGALFALGMLTAETDGVEAAMQLLDSPIPPPRFTLPFGNAPPRLSVVERLVKAYGLALSGYKDLGVTYLRLNWEGHMFPCDTRLMASDLITVDHPDSALKVLPSEAYCFDIFGAFGLLHDRAKYACASEDPDLCARHRERFRRRFPLAQASQQELDLRSLIQMFREGEGDSAGVILDGLLAGGLDHPLLSDLIYRRGIHRVVGRDFGGGIADFKWVEDASPPSEGSGLYYDACFKLGTAYYMIEKYDSSSAYFLTASHSDDGSLAENALFNGGLALEEAGELEAAADAFWRLAMRFPFSERFERSLMRSAYALERSGRHAEAVRIYQGVLRYAGTSEAAAEAMYWTGESYSGMGDHVRAAVEFLRAAHLFPQEAAWAGTAAFQAGIECEMAGLIDHAILIYTENVRRFGHGTDWGGASRDRLTELQAEAQGEQPTSGEGAGD